jgi:hypothetical protein
MFCVRPTPFWILVSIWPEDRIRVVTIITMMKVFALLTPLISKIMGHHGKNCQLLLPDRTEQA